MKRYEMCMVSVGIDGNLVFQFGDKGIWDWVKAKLASSEYSKQHRYTIMHVHTHSCAVKQLKTDVRECAWWLMALLCDDGWEPFDGGSASGVFHFTFRRERVD